MKTLSLARIANYAKYMAPRISSRVLGAANMKLAGKYLSNLRPLALTALANNAGKLPDFLNVPSLDSTAIGTLRENGTIILEFLEPKTAKTFGEKLLADSISFSKEFGAGDKSEGTSDLGIDVVVGNVSMTALIGDGTPIANIRQGTDQGMVDFYNIDNHYPEAKAIREQLLEAGVKDFLEEVSGRKLYLKSMNAYVNVDVTDTRGFHVDAYGVTQIKVFVYLTDVTDLGNGPYCYVVGSHRERELQRVNSFASQLIGLSETDVVLMDFAKAYPILGTPGTLIISDQSGAHRGFPQVRGGRRALCVFNFFQTN